LCTTCCTLGYVLLNGFSVRDAKQSHISEICVLVVCSEILYSLFLCSILGTRRLGMLLTLPSQGCKKNALDLKKVSAEHHVPTKDYVSVGLLSNACLRMEHIVDILDATSDKL
jgi:hypothetical protein